MCGGRNETNRHSRGFVCTESEKGDQYFVFSIYSITQERNRRERATYINSSKCIDKLIDKF